MKVCIDISYDRSYFKYKHYMCSGIALRPIGIFDRTLRPG